MAPAVDLLSRVARQLGQQQQKQLSRAEPCYNVSSVMHVHGIVCVIVVAQSGRCSRLTWFLQQTSVAPAVRVVAAAESLLALLQDQPSQHCGQQESWHMPVASCALYHCEHAERLRS